MTYQEIKKTYPRLFKAYPDTINLYTDDEDKKPITYTLKHYEKRGSRWQLVDEETKQINYIFYYNAIDPAASAFMRNLGGYERTEKAYTRAGLVPIRNTSISPDRTKKTVREYKF